MIRDMLEKICQRCWESDPALRSTMQDIVSDLKLETKSLVRNDKKPNLKAHNKKL